AARRGPARARRAHARVGRWDRRADRRVADRAGDHRVDGKHAGGVVAAARRGARPGPPRGRGGRAGEGGRGRPRTARTARARLDGAVGAGGALLIIRPLLEADAATVLALQIKNEDFLAPYEPTRGADFYTLDTQLARIREAGRHNWLILDVQEPVGFVGLSNVVRGPLQSAVLSYWVDRDHNGKGLCTRAVAEVLAYAFGELALHRVEAGTLVDNR